MSADLAALVQIDRGELFARIFSVRSLSSRPPRQISDLFSRVTIQSVCSGHGARPERLRHHSQERFMHDGRLAVQTRIGRWHAIALGLRARRTTLRTSRKVFPLRTTEKSDASQALPTRFALPVASGVSVNVTVSRQWRSLQRWPRHPPVSSVTGASERGTRRHPWKGKRVAFGPSCSAI